MKLTVLAAFALALSLPPLAFSVSPASPNATSVAVVGQQAGPTPFISVLELSTTTPGTLRSIQFEVVPKPGSVTRPISAVYFADYLTYRGNFDMLAGQINVPVFGLYADYTNTVNLTYRFNDGSVQTDSVTIVTAAFDDPQGYNSPTVLQPRSATALSYDYFMVKSGYPPNSPILIDTDGAVRWVGTTGLGYISDIFIDNSFFAATPPPGSTVVTGITRLELDGTYTFLKDYAEYGATFLDHHNYDPGKDGILVEVNAGQQVESRIYEVDLSGNILRVWDLAAILRDAMTAGGDDPSGFVYDGGIDWFHNNAATYRKSDDTILVSSRENFVIALDYDTGAIKWILGDPTKHWYQYPSLRKYALSVAPGSVPPIGQHAVSITHDDDLLLFDNGANSMFQTPPGGSRTYSSPRKYQIDTQAMVATEVWDYPNGESIFSQYTSSVYEDDAFNYFIDYADITIDTFPPTRSSWAWRLPGRRFTITATRSQRSGFSPGTPFRSTWRTWCSPGRRRLSPPGSPNFSRVSWRWTTGSNTWISPSTGTCSATTPTSPIRIISTTSGSATNTGSTRRTVCTEFTSTILPRRASSTLPRNSSPICTTSAWGRCSTTSLIQTVPARRGTSTTSRPVRPSPSSGRHLQPIASTPRCRSINSATPCLPNVTRASNSSCENVDSSPAPCTSTN